MSTVVMSEPAPPLPCNDVLGPDSSDDEPLVPVHKKDKPVKRERSATATVEPDTKKATHVKRERMWLDGALGPALSAAALFGFQ